MPPGITRSSVLCLGTYSLPSEMTKSELDMLSPFFSVLNDFEKIEQTSW